MAEQDVTVACVYWEGEFRSRNYSSEWVRRLRNMVVRQMTIPFRFVCLSNVEIEGVDTIPLTEDLPGWWSKVELFKPHQFNTHRVLYLDLDTLIVGHLRDIIYSPTDLAFCPPSYQLSGGVPRGGRGVVDVCNSSVIVWDAGSGDTLFTQFTRECMSHFRGDQDWFGHCMPEVDLLPSRWFSKLKHCQAGPKLEHRVILSMPWKCDEAAKKFEWVEGVWR